jgi:hypothetical protein
MKKKNSQTPIAIVIALIVGWLLGTSGVIASKAEEVTPAPVVQGEILSVCINKKTGMIRAASKCVAKTERKTVLGGVGAQGDVGPQGEQGVVGPKGEAGTQGIQGIQGQKGLQGDRGLVGLTGPTGSVSGLRTKEISILKSELSNTCFDSAYFGISILNARTTLTSSQYTGTTFSKSCSNLSSSSVTVFVP